MASSQDSPSNGLVNRPHRSHGNPRKGHKKSRKGCYNCKRRKIKCPENLPSCSNCERLSLRCHYPDRPLVTALQHSPAPVVTLQSTANAFSLTDMRLFHHYLSTAYPHFPLQSESQWLNYITPISHQCEYLMHAILALSASHLDKLAPSNLSGVARGHAQAAMTGLNAAMEVSAKTAEQGDAVIAACYALMMQSWYMDDGMSSFLILSRSCRAVSSQVRSLDIGSVFAEDDRVGKVKSMRTKFEAAPSFSASFVEEALHSLNDLRGLCTKELELNIVDKMSGLFEKLCGSPYEAYLNHMEIDDIITSMDSEDCQHLLSARDASSQLILAHMIAVYLIMRPISCRERRQYTATMYGIRMTEWINVINDKLQDQYRSYISWPLLVSELNKHKTLERYTLAEDGVLQWKQRFTDGSTPFSTTVLPGILDYTYNSPSTGSSPSFQSGNYLGEEGFLEGDPDMFTMALKAQ